MFGGTLEATKTVRDDKKVAITVSLTAEEVQPHIDAFFKRLSKSKIPGFRPGKAPRKVLIQNFGGHDAVYEDISTDIINELAPRAVDEQDVVFISEPETEDFESVEDGKPFEFTVVASVKPSLKLKDYGPVEIELPPEKATEEEVNAQIEEFRNYYYTYNSIEDRPAADGDTVMAKLHCTANGEDVEGLNSESRMVIIGAGAVPEDIEAALIGMKVDETKEIDFEVDAQGSFAYLGTDPIHAEITITEIREKQLPDLDQAFADQVGVESIDALYGQIEDAINEQKDRQIPQLKEQRCLAVLRERLEGFIPDGFVNYVRQDIVREFFNTLQGQGLTFDQFLSQQGITPEEFRKDLDEEAKEVAMESLALDALFEHLDLEITEDDIAAEFEKVDDPEAVRAEWERKGQMSNVREALRRMKASEWMLENAVVTEEKYLEQADAEEE